MFSRMHGQVGIQLLVVQTQGVENLRHETDRRAARSRDHTLVGNGVRYVLVIICSAIMHLLEVVSGIGGVLQ